jgi:hypothetical protein
MFVTLRRFKVHRIPTLAFTLDFIPTAPSLAAAGASYTTDSKGTCHDSSDKFAKCSAACAVPA